MLQTRLNFTFPRVFRFSNLYHEIVKMEYLEHQTGLSIFLDLSNLVINSLITLIQNITLNMQHYKSCFNFP
jgi:hypothetical protein